MTRIHIVVDEEEKERFRCCAESEGKTLSEWLREAAREKLHQEGPLRLDTLQELRVFFASCDARERQNEPDWEDTLMHLSAHTILASPRRTSTSTSGFGRSAVSGRIRWPRPAASTVISVSAIISGRFDDDPDAATGAGATLACSGT